MRFGLPIILALTLPMAGAACGDDGAQARQQTMLTAVRAGLNRIRVVPGGSIARFSDVTLVGANTVCGKVDGQDGFGLRRFTTTGGAVTIEQPGDPASVAAIRRACSAGRVRRVISRNPDHTDISVEDLPPYE